MDYEFKTTSLLYTEKYEFENYKFKRFKKYEFKNYEFQSLSFEECMSVNNSTWKRDGERERDRERDRDAQIDYHKGFRAIGGNPPKG